jgi:transposase-like protein
MVDDKLPPSACPWCTSPDTVRTGTAITRSFYFCLACGKSFERRGDGSPAAPPARKPEGEGT